MVNSLQIIKILSFHLNFFFVFFLKYTSCIFVRENIKQNKQNGSKTELFES